MKKLMTCNSRVVEPKSNLILCGPKKRACSFHSIFLPFYHQKNLICTGYLMYATMLYILHILSHLNPTTTPWRQLSLCPVYRKLRKQTAAKWPKARFKATLLIYCPFTHSLLVNCINLLVTWHLSDYWNRFRHSKRNCWLIIEELEQCSVPFNPHML